MGNFSLTTADGKTTGIPVFQADALYARDTAVLSAFDHVIWRRSREEREVASGRKTFIKTVPGVDDPRKRGKSRRRGDKTRRTALFAQTAFIKRCLPEIGLTNSGLDLATKEALAAAKDFKRLCEVDPTTALQRWLDGE